MGNAEKECIILVEPDKPFAQVLKQRLEQQGKVVRIVPSTPRLKSLLSKTTPQAIVIEVSVGAIAAIADLRAQAQYKTTPILVSATHASREEVSQSMSAGANGFLLTTQHSPAQIVDSILKWCS